MQTKLNTVQKDILRDMKIEAEELGIRVEHNFETTVAWRELGNTVQFSLAVSAPTENKFRRKVGEYLALERLMWNDQCVNMNKGDFYNMLADTLHIYI
jgi:hypothetical protein